MARAARSAPLETRTARLKLKPRGKPYFVPTGKKGVSLGYRRLAQGNGSWVVKNLVGSNGSGGQYVTKVFAEADDYSTKDDATILDYFGAIKKLDGELSELQKSGRYTIQQAVDDYVAWLKLNKKSGRDAEWKLKHYVLKYFDASALASSVTSAQFDAWPKWAIKHKPKGRRKKAGKVKVDTPDQERQRKSTVNRALNLVKACFNRAYLAGYIPSDAAWKRLRRFEGADVARQHWLTIEQCKRLMNAAAPDFRRILQAGLLTGARWGELRVMQARDFDSHSGTVLIATSKSGKPRRIPLSEEGKAAFSEWTAGAEPNDPIFSRIDGKPWGEQDQKRPMAAACEGAKIKPAVGFHTLRHSYASALVQNSVSLAIVAAALGHTDTRMVSKHYGHLAPSHVADAIRANLPSLGVELTGKVKRLGVK